MVLQLVSVLLHGREAKLIADRAADVISGVQNLREAVYEYAFLFARRNRAGLI